MALAKPAIDSADVGLVGLAVMGQNLVLNMADHGFQVAVYNRTTATTEKFVADHPDSKLVPAAELADFVRSIKRPRRIIILVKAGGPTDAVIDSLVPLLEQGDVVVDGGNALYTDTVRREQALATKGLLFVGSGVSGGEEGARFGPSLMPGGKPEAWKILEPPASRSQAPRRASRSPAACRARRTSGPTAPATTSRWCTTASNTATCS
jgi:6-phosphogluconate dehydrogenase